MFFKLYLFFQTDWSIFSLIMFLIRLVSVHSQLLVIPCFVSPLHGDGITMPRILECLQNLNLVSDFYHPPFTWSHLPFLLAALRSSIFCDNEYRYWLINIFFSVLQVCILSQKSYVPSVLEISQLSQFT